MKKADVLAVLRETEEIVYGQIDNIDKDILSHIKFFEQEENKFSLVCTKITEQNLFLDKYNARFPDKIQRLTEKLSTQKNIVFTIPKHPQELLERSKEVDENIKILIEQLNRLRDSLREQHYQDANYNRATSINQKIRRLLQEKSTLINEIANRQRRLEQEKGKANRVLKDCQALNAQSKELSKQGQIAENAENYKKEIISLQEDIDTTLAEKFFATEFKELSSVCTKFLQLTDEQVMNAFEQTLENVMAFQEKLTIRHNEYLEQIETRQNLLDRLQKDFEHTKISHPSKKDQEVSLQEYQKLYIDNGTVMVDNFASLMTQCQEQIKAEDFNGFDSTYQKAIEQFEQMQNDCRIKDEEMQKNFKLAKNIFDVFKKMNCDIDTEYIAGEDNPKDGIKITGKYMDELIELTTANANQDGNINVEINHILENGSDAVNCENFLNPFAEELRNTGIPLIDIHKNGQSVITQKNSSGKKVEQQQKKTHN